LIFISIVFLINDRNICEQKIPQKWKEILENNKNLKNRRKKKNKKKNNDLICGKL
jgi:hypothetical protein